MPIDPAISDPPARAARHQSPCPAGDVASTRAPSWELQALEALDVSAAVFLPASGEVLWRAASFDAMVGGADTSVDTLCARLPGLQAVLDDAAAQREFSVSCGGRSLEAGLRTHAGGVAVLRLRDRSALAQATQRHLEDREQLLFTSRLLSIGEMATTLAHEINQPIGAAANLLRGSVMRLQRQPADSMKADDQAGLLQALQRATEQVLFASRVIARIREYTHSHTPQRQPVDVVALLRACASLLDWETEREAIVVELALPALPLWTLADEVMLQQLFVNLMRNAIDAMRGNPRGQRHLRLHARREGPQLEVTVCDSGSGISEQAEKSLFVPFVSSKPTGTGIGLNICRSFVELHQGRLWFTRNETAGTSFHAALPLMLHSERPQDRAVPGPPPGGGKEAWGGPAFP